MSFVRGAVKIGVGTLLFLGGYMFSQYVHHDPRYAIRRIDDLTYLEDIQQRKRLPIDEKTFQVGNLEYRLQGLVEDPRLPLLLQTADPSRWTHD